MPDCRTWPTSRPKSSKISLISSRNGAARRSKAGVRVKWLEPHCCSRSGVRPRLPSALESRLE